MKTQWLTLRPDQKLLIHTPVGLITAHREKNNPRRWCITVPPSCNAFKEKEEGDKKDLREFPLIREEEGGKIKPDFRVAVPIVNEEGELVGMTEPTGFVLKETSSEKDESNVHEGAGEQAVADSEGSGNGG